MVTKTQFKREASNRLATLYHLNAAYNQVLHQTIEDLCKMQEGKSFHFENENDIALNRKGVEIAALPIIFKEFRNPAPFKACGLSFNNFNGKCVLMAMADETDKILMGVEKVLQIASNVTSQPYYWLTEGTEVWWDDPEDETSGRYKVVKLPSGIDRVEWEDDTIVTISNGTSEAEVTLSEISPTLDL